MQATKSQTSHIRTLQKRRDFLDIQSNGQKWVSQSLILQVQKRDDNDREGLTSDHIRTGFTVSKRTSKLAVTRNRIKRRLRAVAADTIGAHAKAGYDYILVGRPATETRSYETLKTDLKWCLKRLDLLK